MNNLKLKIILTITSIIVSNSLCGTNIFLIAPFENISGTVALFDYEFIPNSNGSAGVKRIRIDRYSEAPRSILEDIILGFDSKEFEGIEVVERQRLDSMLLETQFIQSNNLDASNAFKIAKKLNANALVIGTVQHVNSEDKFFEGYGIKTFTTIISASVRVRVIDIATSKIMYSEVFKGEKSYSQNGFGGVESADVAYEVIDSALAGLKESERFKRIFNFKKKSAKTGLIQVKFQPDPDRTSVHIDGRFRKTTPCILELESGIEVNLKLEHPDRQIWNTKIIPEEGMVIDPVLGKRRH